MSRPMLRTGWRKIGRAFGGFTPAAGRSPILCLAAQILRCHRRTPGHMIHGIFAHKQRTRPFHGRALMYHLIFIFEKTPALFRRKRRVLRTRGVLWGEPSGSSPPLPCPLHSVRHGLVDGPDRVQEHTVLYSAVSSLDGGLFCVDESLLLQPVHVLPHRVGAHPCALADSLKAGPALIRLPVLAE